MYGRDPGGLLVVLVLSCCVNTMEAKIETALLTRGRWAWSWHECGMKSWRQVYSCNPVGLFVAVDSRWCWRLPLCIHLCAQMLTATFVEKDSASMVPLNGLLRGWWEDQVGTSSESSYIATWPLKQKLLFQLCSARKTTHCARSVITSKCVIWHLRVYRNMTPNCVIRR